ncbi:energy-coupling factor ABC transporter ATP-binding protein [Thioclava sp. FR2]|uniref:energy-coupling factor ABC transporter ATP-binding protein n=1 Tax=Thioclava sp. FR2 TaxID=3445780 RepID=UPI003EBE87CA
MKIISRQGFSAPSPSDDDGLLLRRACVTLGGKAVLQDINLHLTERRIGIIGRNGSGKSTLLRLIAGLIPASSGEVRVDGIDPSKDRKALLSRLGILFQNPDHQILFPTVAEELAFGLIQQGQTKSAAMVAARTRLKAEGKGGWADLSISTLSQGQRHWLCLLAVLMMEPDTILLDEPLAGLDLPTQARLARAFAALPQRLVTITHDPDLVKTADRVVWLEAGRVLAEGKPDKVLPGFMAAMHAYGLDDADADFAG